MDRARVWLAVSPVLAVGVLVSHALAYRATGTAVGSTHAYLVHAPQILLLLAVVGVTLAAFTRERRAPAVWAFPLAAFAVFGAQEHVERLAHTGDLPFLLDSPAFLVGMLLQLPFAIGAWLLSRALLESFEEVREPRSRLPHAVLEIAPPPTPDVRAVALRPCPGRGPPLLLRR